MAGLFWQGGQGLGARGDGPPHAGAGASSQPRRFPGQAQAQWEPEAQAAFGGLSSTPPALLHSSFGSALRCRRERQNDHRLGGSSTTPAARIGTRLATGECQVRKACAISCGKAIWRFHSWMFTPTIQALSALWMR